MLSSLYRSVVNSGDWLKHAIKLFYYWLLFPICSVALLLADKYVTKHCYIIDFFRYSQFIPQGDHLLILERAVSGCLF